jgi:hypothetical protein
MVAERTRARDKSLAIQKATLPALPKDLCQFIPDTMVKKIVRVLDEAMDAEVTIGEGKSERTLENWPIRLQAAEMALRVRAGWHKPQVNVNVGYGPQQYDNDARDWVAQARSVVETAKGRTIDITAVTAPDFDVAAALG